MVDLVFSMLLGIGTWCGLAWFRRREIEGRRLGEVRLGPVLAFGIAFGTLAGGVGWYLRAGEGAEEMATMVGASMGFGAIAAFMGNVWCQERGWFRRGAS